GKGGGERLADGFCCRCRVRVAGSDPDQSGHSDPGKRPGRLVHISRSVMSQVRRASRFFAQPAGRSRPSAVVDATAPMNTARLGGDHVKVDLLEAIVLTLQHRPVEVVKLGVGPIVGVLDPEQGAYRGPHWMIVVPGNSEGLRTGGEILIAKLRGNQDQQ